MSNIVWGLFEHRNRFYIHTTNKNGTLATFSVEGQTLQSLLVYLEKHLDYPNTTLIRYLNSPAKCMGSERIAKRVKETMTQLGIPTEAFKAHSLRGATATHLMLNGMEPQWVQSRGGWQSPETMQMYYNRIHQQQDWEAALQGKTDAIKHCFNCVVPALTSPQTEADEGRRRGGEERQGTTQMKQLAAHGVLRELFLQVTCPSCGQPIRREAAYICRQCRTLRHIRCHPISSAGAPSLLCFLCQQKVVNLDPGKGLIVDVMGVCEPKSP